MASTAPEEQATGWSSEGQGWLFDPHRFYDRAADPAQSWNLIPGIPHELASDDDLYDWGLLDGTLYGRSGWGVAS